MCIRDSAKSASGWANHKVRALKHLDGTDDEKEEQQTETQQSAPQNKERQDTRPKSYRCGKPKRLQLSLIHIYIALHIFSAINGI